MPSNSPLFVDIGQGLFLSMGYLTIPTWDSLGRPKKAKRGTFGFNLQTHSLEYWDGSDWFTAVMLGT
jgi:hypothetical protein